MDYKKYVEKMYLENDYIRKNPSLHEEDSKWKITKIIPLVNDIIKDIDKEEINLLDVGGGKGIILNQIAAHIENKHHIKVNKFALDLSPEMLKAQQESNHDLKKVLNENINETSLKDKEIDISLLIDVLEHVKDSKKALNEIRRISKFVIFKVPLEDNLMDNILNLINKDKLKQDNINKYGHIQLYNISSLKNQIETENGKIIDLYPTNVAEYRLNQEKVKNKSKVIYLVENQLFKFFPNFCCRIFFDFIVMAVKCY